MSNVRRLGPQAILQLRIELQDSQPLIWRKVLVPDNISLIKLHKVFQAVMGWDDYHLHEFIIDQRHYGPVDPDDDLSWDLGPEMLDEQRKRLDKVLGHKKQFEYIYDYGDNWWHKVTLEKTIPLELDEDMPIATCAGGEMACPPEDVGGIGRYYEFLEAMADPEHDMHEDMMRWWGEPFDPEHFDSSLVNQRLRQIKL